MAHKKRKQSGLRRHAYHLNCVAAVCLSLICCSVASFALDAGLKDALDEPQTKSVKKDLTLKHTAADIPEEGADPDPVVDEVPDNGQEDDVIKSKMETTHGEMAPLEGEMGGKESILSENPTESQDDQNEKNFNYKIFSMNLEIPTSYEIGVYFLFILSLAAIGLSLCKIYKMRLTRAERRYGVHGDRSSQELTPLPIAIEDESEDEDHTLYEIRRQDIRIL